MAAGLGVSKGCFVDVRGRFEVQPMAKTSQAKLNEGFLFTDHEENSRHTDWKTVSSRNGSHEIRLTSNMIPQISRQAKL